TLGVAPQNAALPTTASQQSQETGAWVPLFRATATSPEAENMVIQEKPFNKLYLRVPSLASQDGAYAFLIPTNAHSPLFRTGDTAVIEPNLPYEPGCDVVLRRSIQEPDGDDMFGTLTDYNEREWNITQNRNCKPVKLKVKRSDYPHCHRIIAKLYRGIVSF